MIENVGNLLLNHLKQIEATFERSERTLNESARQQVDTIALLRDMTRKP